MCLPVALPKYFYKPSVDNPKLSPIQISNLVKYLKSNQALSEEFYTSLTDAINKEIGPDLDNKQGSLHTRIQRWIWKNYSFKYVPMKGDKQDLLEEIIQRLRNDIVDYPIEVELSKYMDWGDGDFGDGGSCYFGSNSVTRHYLNSLDNFRTLKVYKDGSGFGRALLLGNINNKDFFILYNTYPGHRECKHQSHFADALKAALENHSQKEFYTKQVTFEHRSEGSWFYTNGNSGVLFCEATLAEEAEKENRYVISLGNRPEVTSLPNYIGQCLLCKESLFTYREYLELGDKLGICKRCSTHSSRLATTMDGKKLPAVHNRLARTITMNRHLVAIAVRCLDNDKTGYITVEEYFEDKGEHYTLV